MAKASSGDIDIFAFDTLNQRVNPFVLPSNALLKSVNMTHNRVGQLSTRAGYVAFLNAVDASEVRSLIPFVKNDGTTKRLLRVSGTKVYSWDYAAANWGSSIKTLTNSTVPMGSTFFPDTNKLICGNGVDATFTYDGTSLVSPAAAPLGKYFDVYQNRVVTSGVIANPFRVYASKIGDETNWTEDPADASSAQHVDVNGIVYGIKVSADKVTIFHSNGIARWDIDSKVELPTSVALANAASLTANEEFWFFANKNAIYVYNNQSFPKSVSRSIETIFRNGAKTSAATVVSAAHKDIVYFSLGATTDIDAEAISNCLAAYSYQDNYFEIHSLAHLITAMAVTATGLLIFGDSAGNTWEWNSGVLDSTSAINGHIETPPLFTSKELTSFDTVTVFSNGGPIDVFYSVNGGEYAALGTVDSTVKTLAFLPDTIGNYIQFNLASAAAFTLNGIIVSPRGARKGER